MSEPGGLAILTHVNLDPEKRVTEIEELADPAPPLFTQSFLMSESIRRMTAGVDVIAIINRASGEVMVVREDDTGVSAMLGELAAVLTRGGYLTPQSVTYPGRQIFYHSGIETIHPAVNTLISPHLVTPTHTGRSLMQKLSAADLPGVFVLRQSDGVIQVFTGEPGDVENVDLVQHVQPVARFELDFST